MAAYVTYRRSPARSIVLTGLALLSLGFAACGKLGVAAGGDEMSWARQALERNNRLEVVASDPQTSTFTVRVKDTGELRMIKLDEIIAAPPGTGATPSSTPATPSSSPPASTEALAPSTTASAEAAAAGNPSAAQATTVQSERPATPSARVPAAGSTQQADDGSAATMAGNAPRTGFQPEPAPRAEAPSPNSDVAAVTPGGRTLESGPGYVIKTASKAASTTRTRERSSKTTAAVERRHDPIVCQGDRLLQIDNRNLEFDGDAVSAEDGCEIHITNSHISAKGVGVSVRAANVHIENSQIEGDTASIDASKGGQVYASSSTFKGISRRLDNSSFHDLGGNVWN